MTISMLKGIHRRVLGLSKDDQVIAANGVVAGGDGRPAIVFPSPDTVAHFEDFLGDLVPDEWNFQSGDTSADATGTNVAGTNGIFRVALGSTSVMAPGSGAGINSGALQWKANQGVGAKVGRLRMSARLRITEVAAHAVATGTGSIFVGFTDNTGSEQPIYDTGATGGPISAAADAVGLIYGARGDTGWVAVAAKSTAGDSGDQKVVLAGTNPVSNIWQVLEVEINRGISDTGGNATFYVNGIPKARINSPIASTVALTPVVRMMGITADTGLTKNRFDLDWINVSAPRDSGS